MKTSIENNLVVVETESEAETEHFGRALALTLQAGDVVALIGPLGAGKTRLSRAIAEALGVDPQAVSSPTFTLIHEYEGIMFVYHFDTYRLRNAEEFDDLGASDYWTRGDGVCLIEWADRVLDRLPLDAWKIEIEPLSPDSRRIRVRPRGNWTPADLVDTLRLTL